MKKLINAITRTVTFTFDGDLAPVVCQLQKVSVKNQEYAALFGLGHRIGDNAAIQKSAENNYTVTEAMRRAAVVEMRDHLESGTNEWNLKVGAAPKINPVLQALAAKLGITYEEAAGRNVDDLLGELMGAAQS